MPKVSIIIPFNNVEAYIRECLDSVVNQTLDDIEIILVNDASSDKSREIAQEYIEKDSRIKIIDLKERQGQGFARNRAIEIAQGEYIGFVDSDDKIEKNMFFELYNKAKENDNDIVICQAREYDDINERFILSGYYSLKELEKMSNKVFSAKDIKDVILKLNVVLWNKIYKREYLLKTGEKFPEGFIYEDLPFFFATFLPAKRIQIVWKNLYIYRINRKNSTMVQFNKKILDRPYMVSLTYEKLKQFDFLSDITDKIKGWIIDDLFHRYSLLQENYQKEYFFLMKKIFQNLDINDSDDIKWKKVYYFEGYKLVVNNNFEDFNQKVFNLYTDIHIVEDKILSKVYNRLETDSLINDIYLEINTIYNYISSNIEKNSEILNLNLKNTKDDIENELHQNINDIKLLGQEKTDDLYSQINNSKEELYKKTTDDYKSLTNIIEAKINSIKNETELENKNLSDGIYKEINNIKNESDNNIKKLDKEINSNKEEIKTIIENKIKEIEKKFEEKLSFQKIEYENKIKELNSKIEYLSQSPFKRYMEKLKNKNA